MISEKELINNIDQLISDLKSCITNAGISGDSSEFQIMTELFLFKFLNDKFKYRMKQLDSRLANAQNFDEELSKLTDNELEKLYLKLGGETAIIKNNQTIGWLFNHQNDQFDGQTFAEVFDNTLSAISSNNSSIFGVKISSKGDAINKIDLFEGVCRFIIDPNKRVSFAKAVISNLANSYNFEYVFQEKYDFFSTIFEHLISDYNNNGGGTYAEYYTPKSVAQIIAKILVDTPVQNVTCYDPTAGSGTLLLALAHEVGEDKCTIYSQDATQKSVKLLRLNLILNSLTHSLNNIHQGDILTEPACKDGNDLQQFDLIISNPPFKLDFSENQPKCLTDSYMRNGVKRFFAGVPNIPKDQKDGMAIYLLVLQHILYSLKEGGKAGIVVPTKFLDWTNSIAKDIRAYLIDNKMLRAVVSMPANVFANTGTNVSVLFVDKSKVYEEVFLFDATDVGREEVLKINKKNVKKTILDEKDQKYIVETINQREVIGGKSIVKDSNSIKERNYSLCAGQYFDIDINETLWTESMFNERIEENIKEIKELFEKSECLDKEIIEKMKSISYKKV